MLERLTFGEGEGYDALALAEHLARYQLAKPLCADRTVLDIACGQGYGTRLLADWGARRVVGVDVSPGAVERARALFQRPNIEYVIASAESVDSLLPAGAFDLIVSLETIEHLPDPARFLRALKTLAREHATIIVSCPNDHVYYRSDEPGNPFHLRRYTFKEFVRESQLVLGPATAWYLGAPGVAFINYPAGGLAVGDEKADNSKLFESRQVGGYLVPTRASEAPSERTASYYVGVWGPVADDITSITGYAITYDYLKNMWDQTADIELAALREQFGTLLESHRTLVEELARAHARYGSVLRALEGMRKALPASVRSWLGRRRMRQK